MTFYNQLVLTEFLELIVKASRLSHVLDTLFAQPWAVFIWGAPGIGKSSIARQVAERHDATSGWKRILLTSPWPSFTRRTVGKFSKAVRPSRHFSDPKRGGQI